MHTPTAGKRSSRWPWLAAATAVAMVTISVTVAGTPSTLAAPARSAQADTAVPAAPLSCGPPDFFIPCYSPSQSQVAYGVAPLLRSGITGSGEIVVMPELARAPGANYTDIRRDLAAFDARFGLPAAKLKVTTTIAGASAPYVAATEEVTDTEMVRDRARRHPRRGPSPRERRVQHGQLHDHRYRIGPHCRRPECRRNLDQREPWRDLLHPCRGSPDPRGSAAGCRSPCHVRRVVRGYRRDQRQRPA